MSEAPDKQYVYVLNATMEAFRSEDDARTATEDLIIAIWEDDDETKMEELIAELASTDLNKEDFTFSRPDDDEENTEIILAKIGIVEELPFNS